ncbi:MAG: histidine--tRNA ligase [bacterium]
MPKAAKTSKKTNRNAKKIVSYTKLVSKIKGMKDVLPDDFKYWNLVSRKAVELAKLYSYKRFDVPLLENVALYDKTSGKTSELVNKELYSFTNKSNEKIAIRPDITPSLMRAVLEHNLINPGEIFKSFWLGPVIRYDKMHGGRLRQFNQFSLNVLGDFGPSADAQIISIAYNFFKELQVDIEVQINSLGCNNCRQEYIQIIKDYFKERGRKAKLSAEAKKILLKNPLQILEINEDKADEIIANLPPIVDHLCDNCRRHFEIVLEHLDNFSIPYNLNTNLVSARGFDYYNKTIFEFMPVGDATNPVALGGGGNYSELIEKIGGLPLSACGFGIDIEKTISKIRSKNLVLADEDKPDIFIAQISGQAKQKAMLLFEELRRAGFKARENFIQDKLKAQLEEAESLKVRFTLILGQKELLDNTILIRDMESGVQETVDSRKLINELDKRLNIS